MVGEASRERQWIRKLGKESRSEIWHSSFYFLSAFPNQFSLEKRYCFVQYTPWFICKRAVVKSMKPSKVEQSKSRSVLRCSLTTSFRTRRESIWGEKSTRNWHRVQSMLSCILKKLVTSCTWVPPVPRGDLEKKRRREEAIQFADTVWRQDRCCGFPKL